MNPTTNLVLVLRAPRLVLKDRLVFEIFEQLLAQAYEKNDCVGNSEIQPRRTDGRNDENAIRGVLTKPLHDLRPVVERRLPIDVEEFDSVQSKDLESVNKEEEIKPSEAYVFKKGPKSNVIQVYQQLA